MRCLLQTSNRKSGQTICMASSPSCIAEYFAFGSEASRSIGTNTQQSQDGLAVLITIIIPITLIQKEMYQLMFVAVCRQNPLIAGGWGMASAPKAAIISREAYIDLGSTSNITQEYLWCFVDTTFLYCLKTSIAGMRYRQIWLAFKIL